MGLLDDAYNWFNGTEFFPSAQPPRVDNGAGAVNAANADLRARATGDDGSLRSARGELERAGIDPQSLQGYEAIENYARARLKETMKAPAMTNAEKIGGVLQNIGGVWAHAQNNPQVGQSLLSNNYLTQHSKTAQDHKAQMNKLNSELAMNTVSNFDKFYTGDLETRRKLKLQARQQIMALEAEKLPVPPHLYEAAGLKPSTAPIQAQPQAPQGPAGPAAAPPSGGPPVAPSGPLPEVPGVSVAPPDPSNMAMPQGMPPMETGAAPAPAPQGAAPPTAAGGFVPPASPEAQAVLQKAKIAAITGNKEMADLHMKEYERLTKVTDDILEVNAAMADPEGFGSTLMGIKRAGSSSPQTKYEATIQEELAKDFIASQKMGSSAAQALAGLNVMKEAISNPDVYLGTGGELVHVLKKGAQDLLGVNVSGVPDAEIIKRTGAEVALALKEKMPGPMSDGDRKFMLAQPANLSDDPDSARRLVELGIANREYELEVASAARQYAAEHKGRLDDGWFAAKAEIEQRYQKSMGAIVKKLREGKQEPRRPPTAGTPFMSIRGTYGLD
jgi:DNA-binding protein YbaB